MHHEAIEGVKFARSLAGGFEFGSGEPNREGVYVGDALAHHYGRGSEVVACKRGQCFIGERALDGRSV